MRSSTLIVLLLLLFAFSFQGCKPIPEEEEEVTTDTDSGDTTDTDSGDTTDTGGPVCTYGLVAGVMECYYYSDWKSVDEMPGVSYKVTCQYMFRTTYDSNSNCGVGFSSSPDVCFRVKAKIESSERYLRTETYFGVPAYNSAYITDYFTASAGLNDGEITIAYDGHWSLDAPKKQCQEPYTGKIEFSYADKYGNKTGSTVATKEFDSTTLPLNF